MGHSARGHGSGVAVAAQGVASVRCNRWVILAGYALLTACTQFLWLAYAPITAQTHRIMAVSEGAVGDLAGVFPLVYVILALPAGRWLDARFGRALGLGAVLTDAGGLTLLLRVQAAVAVLAAAWVLAVIRTPAAYPGDPSVAVSMRWLRGDRFMWLLAGLLFVGMGVFNAVATWLDSILTDFGHGGASGYLIALMTVGGIAGGALLPGVAARRDQRRGVLEIAVAVTAAAFAVIAAVHNPVLGGAVLFVAGFFLLAGLPVVLDWSELAAGPERAGGTAGFLLLAGNLGGVVLVLIIQAAIGNPYLSLAALSLACLAGLALATRLPARDSRAASAGATHQGGAQ